MSFGEGMRPVKRWVNQEPESVLGRLLCRRPSWNWVPEIGSVPTFRSKVLSRLLMRFISSNILDKQMLSVWVTVSVPFSQVVFWSQSNPTKEIVWANFFWHKPFSQIRRHFNRSRSTNHEVIMKLRIKELYFPHRVESLDRSIIQLQHKMLHTFARACL